MVPTVFIIAGSDPTGGAGIQADLKTLNSIGVYGAAAITCITVQNSRGVMRIEPLSTSLVKQQIEAVLEDHHVTHIKIGMVGTCAIAQTIEFLLTGFSGEVIYDPVMVATTGQNLMEPSAVEGCCQGLIDKVTVLTPNLPELGILTSKKINSDAEAIAAAKILLSRYDRLRAVLVKGGHGGDGLEMTDHLVMSMPDDAVQTLSSPHPRLESRNTHGTGCTMASAFTAFHCRLGDDVQSFHCSVDFVQQALMRSISARVIKNSSGRGPLLHHLI